MKYVVIFIIFLSWEENSSYVKPFRIYSEKDCANSGQELIEKISKYYYEIDGNRKMQGWYNRKGELVVGYYCDS